MPSLIDLQRAFAAELRREGAANLGSVVAEDKFPAQRRLNVYRNNVNSNLRAALEATYPVVKKLVGPEFFRYLSDEYSTAQPSRSGDQRHYGRVLPEFLDNFEAVKDLPYLSDIARLEWACSLVSVAARNARELVRSRYPIFSIWAVNQDTHTGDKSVNLDEGAQSVLVVRRILELELWLLDEPAHS